MVLLDISSNATLINDKHLVHKTSVILTDRDKIQMGSTGKLCLLGAFSSDRLICLSWCSLHLSTFRLPRLLQRRRHAHGAT